MKITRSHQRRVRGLRPVFTVRLHQRSLSYFIYFCIRHIPSHSQFSVSAILFFCFRLVRFTSQPLAFSVLCSKFFREHSHVLCRCRVQFTTPQCIRFIWMQLPYRHLHANPLAGVVRFFGRAQHQLIETNFLRQTTFILSGASYQRNNLQIQSKYLRAPPALSIPAGGKLFYFLDFRLICLAAVRQKFRQHANTQLCGARRHFPFVRPFSS